MLDQTVRSPHQATPACGHKSQGNQTIILSNNPDNILGTTCWTHVEHMSSEEEEHQFWKSNKCCTLVDAGLRLRRLQVKCQFWRSKKFYYLVDYKMRVNS